MAFSLHGIKIPGRKNTADASVVRISTPSTVTIPLRMHIGAPAVPVVKVGEHVDIGSLIAENDRELSSPVYASVSGKVTKITDILGADGQYVPAVIITSDGENTVAEACPPQLNSKEDFINALRRSGLVGLGGAGFPTYAKFMTDKSLDCIVINCTECEPYITSDTHTMLEDAPAIADAIKLIDRFFDISRFIIGIEKHNKKAIEAMNRIAAENSKVSVKVLPDAYPQGGEKVLVYKTTGRIIKPGCLPADVGCLVLNCTTMAFISKYVKTGMPLTEKTITVAGGSVKEPKNVIVPVGTAVSDVFDFCGGFTSDPVKVLYGGPMMGISVPSLDVPVLKQTNALIALSAKEAKASAETACIRCGNCVNSCPFGLAPVAIKTKLDAGDCEALGKLNVESCMECGCCAYVCPACKPLVQTNKMAKAAYRKYKENIEKEQCE